MAKIKEAIGTTEWVQLCHRQLVERYNAAAEWKSDNDVLYHRIKRLRHQITNGITVKNEVMRFLDYLKDNDAEIVFRHYLSNLFFSLDFIYNQTKLIVASPQHCGITNEMSQDAVDIRINEYSLYLSKLDERVGRALDRIKEIISLYHNKNDILKKAASATRSREGSAKAGKSRKRLLGVEALAQHLVSEYPNSTEGELWNRTETWTSHSAFETLGLSVYRDGDKLVNVDAENKQRAIGYEAFRKTYLRPLKF